VEDFIFR